MKITKNTDAVDIDNHCLGLSCYIQGQPELNKARGLHVQIKHNADPETFRAASELSNLIATAPEMLAALENLENDDSSTMPESAWLLVKNAIKKAKGG